MSSGYNFYMQKYPQGTTTFAIEDIESKYNCVYKQFSGVAFNGEVKNAYTESFAERSGVRVYTPSSEDLAYKESECKLQLLFKRATCQEDSERFYSSFAGVKSEYHDTFRKKYVTLLMTKRPSIVQEKLYSKTPYQLVEYTFTNIYGRTFDETQMES